MYSGETIQKMSDEAARKARATKRQPMAFFDADHVERFFGRKTRDTFPNFGSYVPRGWTLHDQLFCDSSGLGAPDEPALTQEQLKAKILEDVANGNAYGYAITECGQFQLFLGRFVEEKTKAKSAAPRRRRSVRQDEAGGAS
jgi:hypothetical protein